MSTNDNECGKDRICGHGVPIERCPAKAPEPTGDDNWKFIVEAYPDARIWEHAPDDWQIAAGADGEIKTYGHKTAEAAIATVARRIRAMKAEPKAPDVLRENA